MRIPTAFSLTVPCVTVFSAFLSQIRRSANLFTPLLNQKAGETSKLLCRAQCYKTKTTFTSEYIKDHIFRLQQKIWRHDWSSQLYTHNLSSCEVKAWKNSGLNRIQTHDLCDTGAVLQQPSYQANWELVTLLVRNIPVSGFRNNWHTNINWAQQWTKPEGFLPKRDC